MGIHMIGQLFFVARHFGLEHRDVEYRQHARFVGLINMHRPAGRHKAQDFSSCAFHPLLSDHVRLNSACAFFNFAKLLGKADQFCQGHLGILIMLGGIRFKAFQIDS